MSLRGVFKTIYIIKYYNSSNYHYGIEFYQKVLESQS